MRQQLQAWSGNPGKYVSTMSFQAQPVTVSGGQRAGLETQQQAAANVRGSAAQAECHGPTKTTGCSAVSRGCEQLHLAAAAVLCRPLARCEIPILHPCMLLPALPDCCCWRGEGSLTGTCECLCLENAAGAVRDGAVGASDAAARGLPRCCCCGPDGVGQARGSRSCGAAACRRFGEYACVPIKQRCRPRAIVSRPG